LNPLGGGLIGIVCDGVSTASSSTKAEVNIHYQGDRADPDLVTLP